MTNATYHLMVELAPTGPVGKGEESYRLNEVFADREYAAESVRMHHDESPGTRLLWIEWSAFSGARFVAVSSGTMVQGEGVCFVRDRCGKCRRAIMEGISLAIRMDAREFGEDKVSSVKPSPTVKPE